MLPNLLPVLGFGPARPALPQRFEQQYNCFSMAFVDRPHLEEGDKILLPQSAFDMLARMNVDFPMLFELSNPSMGRRTHCGVLEFTAEEGKCYIPFWMMQNLMLGEGSIINVKNVSLPKATFVKFRPQKTAFIEISNPKAVLEKKLRSFSCVTVGDHLCINYMDKNFYLEITEVRPGDAASIIETDCNVDFDEPADYKEASSVPMETSTSGGEVKPRELQRARIGEPQSEEKSFTAFGGGARRIDNKPLPAGFTESKGSESKGFEASTPMAEAKAAPVSAPLAAAKHSKTSSKYSKTQKLGAFSGAGRSFS